jgi:hypothetical protein
MDLTGVRSSEKNATKPPPVDDSLNNGIGGIGNVEVLVRRPRRVDFEVCWRKLERLFLYCIWQEAIGTGGKSSVQIQEIERIVGMRSISSILYGKEMYMQWFGLWKRPGCRTPCEGSEVNDHAESHRTPRPIQVLRRARID